jgi:hypothetical protein
MRYFAALWLPVVFTVTAWCQPEDAQSLIDKLGSAKFKERESATLALDRLGKDALPLLRAALKTAEPEQRHRAAVLIQRIEERLEVEQLLAPKKVRLSYNNVPVLDALDDFAAKACVTIEVEGDHAGPRGRLLSLDTGEVTFWEALDQFCAKAGLRERPLSPLVPLEPLPRIVLEDAKPLRLPAAYLGGVRLRALLPPPGEPGQEITVCYPPIETPVAVGFLLEVRSEPRIPWQGIRSVRITRALDEHDQELAPTLPLRPESAVEPQEGDHARPRIWNGQTGKPLPPTTEMAQAVVRLKPGKQPARSLKEIKGTLTVELIGQRQVLAIENLLQAAGKVFKTKDGTTLKLLEVAENDQSLGVLCQVCSGPDAVKAGAGVRVFKDANGVLNIIHAPASRSDPFALAANQGEAIHPSRCETTLVENGMRGLEVQYRLHFARPNMAATGLRLIYSVPRPVMADVPFVLRDVPLADSPQLPAVARDEMIILTR